MLLIVKIYPIFLFLFIKELHPPKSKEYEMHEAKITRISILFTIIWFKKLYYRIPSFVSGFCRNTKRSCWSCQVLPVILFWPLRALFF